LREKGESPMKNNLLFLDKKRLRQILSGHESPLTPYLFRKLFFTDDFIQNVLNIDFLQFSRIRVFNVEQTQKIIQHFKIKEEDLE
jgi:hypothetical protein